MSSSGGAQRIGRLGIETPRLWSRPLRELTKDTSHGFEVIDFAREILGIELYPWQKWLLIHALELREDGTYRFRKLVVLVARQNGKTTLLMVLALWWLFVDSESFPEHLAPEDFLILGSAQNLDLAEEAWQHTADLCDPEDDRPLSERVAIPALQGATLRPVRTNGKKAIRLRNGARYEVRASSRKAGRGKSTARVMMDELREHQSWDAWAAVSKTANATFNSQLWGISNAGDARSVVLLQLRSGLLKTLDEWERYVDTHLVEVEEFASGHDMTSGLFEWSAPEGCELNDPQAILQANPSIGYGFMTWETVMSDLVNDPEGIFRTEVLCQWVTALVDTYIDGRAWQACVDRDSQPVGRLMLGVDTSADRSKSYVAVAGIRADGLMHCEVIMERTGMLWVPAYVAEVAAKQGITHVAVQARGAPAGEFIPLLTDLGLQVFEVGGLGLGASAGQMRDKIRDRLLRHLDQPLLNMAVAGAVARKLGDVRVWDRIGSVVDIAPLIAACNAVFAVEMATDESVRSAYEDHQLLVL
jgi:phage terminase large subunit-like protein